MARTLAANIPVWILSLDLSKAFDRVDWGALWLALSEQGVSTHMLWILHTLYSGQHGDVTGQGGGSRTFQINAGVRQGCLLSPKMFSAVLHWAMSKWRTWAEGCSFGFALGDGLPPLLDLRFADDIFIFARSSQEIMTLLDKLVQLLGDAGLKLNAEKNCVDHNRSSTTTVLDNLDWSRDQSKGKGIRSQMVGLHVIFSRFKKWSSGY